MSHEINSLEITSSGYKENAGQRLTTLQQGLGRCVTRKASTPRESSIATTTADNEYTGGYVASDTHLLYIPSEQVVLMKAAQYGDYGVESVTAMQEDPNPNELVLPLTTQILIDYTRRSGTTLAYEVVDTAGKRLFETDDVYTLQPYYQPESNVLSKVYDSEVQPNVAQYEGQQDEDALESIQAALHFYAIEGLEKGFPTSDSGGRYGTAVMTRNNNIYYAGQYSSFEHRTNIHSEMAAVISAIMHDDPEITHLGLISNRFNEEPCNACGCCRQFLAEVSSRLDLDITLSLFNLDGDQKTTTKLNEYLPGQWSNQWMHKNDRS